MDADLHLAPDEREQISHLAEIAVTGLSFVFVGLLVVEFALPLSATQARWLELAGWVIWVVFALDFVIRFAVADAKLAYLRTHWLTALAVMLPAFRVFRALRALRAARSLRLARLVTGTNRGARALRRIGSFAGAGYVAALTALVWLLGAAGIVYLERGQPDTTITSFPEALWWSATTLIQQGSEQHPETAEGRILGVMVMIFALAVSGYITAALAAFLLGRRQAQADTEMAARAVAPNYVPASANPAGVGPEANGRARTDRVE